MLTQVPFYVCSIAFFVGVPSAANPGQPSAATASEAIHAVGKHRTILSKKQLISMPASGRGASALSGQGASASATLGQASIAAPGKQGMKFVSRYIRNNDDCLTSVKQRSDGPFAIIDSVLHHYGLPLQLKYLAVIESELKASALSRVGARGPWQLMPSTAHVLGLKVNRRSDERTNYYKSTKAAAEYLRDLHHEFGDWLLVLAAYNGGPRPVYRAIHKSHSRNFWTLQRYLPAESRQHVKKFIATAYYFENTANTTTTGRATQITQVARTTSAPGTAPAPVSRTQPMAQIGAPVKTISPEKGAVAKSAALPESDGEKFNRLMRESAVSLKASHDLLLPGED